MLTETVAVNEEMMDVGRQCIGGLMHGPIGRLQNIDLVDHVMPHKGGRPRMGAGLHTLFEGGTPDGRKHLGIVNAFDMAIRRQDNSSRYDGTCEGSAACFIDPGHQPVLLPERQLGVCCWTVAHTGDKPTEPRRLRQRVNRRAE